MGKELGLAGALLALAIVQGCGDDQGSNQPSGGSGNIVAGAGGEGGSAITEPNAGGAGAGAGAAGAADLGGSGGSDAGAAGDGGQAGEAGAGGAAPQLPEAIPPRDESDMAEPEGKVGFITLEPNTFSDILEVKDGGTSTEARLFYRFIPADEDAKDKPVFVIFNGGPGYTSMLLYTFGTGPLTLNAEAPNDPPTANPNSFTRLGNLLYIDARQAGFSYGVTGDPSSDEEREKGFAAPSIGSVIDAADFVRVVLRVLKEQPALENNRVVLVGESYGGARAPLMLSLLLFPETPFLKDEALSAEITSHYETVFQSVDSSLFGPGLFSLQFGWQVLIEPYLGTDQDRFQDDLAFELRQRMATEHGVSLEDQDNLYCWDDASRLVAYCDAIDPGIVNALLEPTSFERWMGATPESVPGLTAASRVGAFRLQSLTNDVPLDPAAWLARTGELPAWDRYFSAVSMGGNRHAFDTVLNRAFVSFAFVAAARYANTLITNAAYDRAVRSEAIVPALRNSTIIADAVTDVGYDGDDPDQPTERFFIDYADSEYLGPATRRSVSFPTYAASGHVVTLTESGKFFNDVKRFYEETSADKAR